MRYISWKRLLGAVLVLGMLSVNTSYAKTTQQNIDDAKNQIDSLQQQRDDAQAQVNDISDKKDDIEEVLESPANIVDVLNRESMKAKKIKVLDMTETDM